MHCPFCGFARTKVVNSRVTKQGDTVRRRRECRQQQCRRRFTTLESMEKLALMVIKRNERREPFERQKIYNGIMKACRKVETVKPEQIEAIVKEIEKELYSRREKEVSSLRIGEMVLQRLRKLDEVAYLRFASVYRKFEDVTKFDEELQQLLKKKEKLPT